MKTKRRKEGIGRKERRGTRSMRRRRRKKRRRRRWIMSRRRSGGGETSGRERMKEDGTKCDEGQYSSFIHSGYFCSGSRSTLLLIGAPVYSIDTVSEIVREKWVRCFVLMSFLRRKNVVSIIVIVGL